jgi:hypothetical protein
MSYCGSVAKRDADQFAAKVQAGISRGLDVVDAWRAARAQRPTRAQRELREQRDRAVATHRREVKAYERRKNRARVQTIGGTAVAGVAGTVGVLDVVVEATTSQVGVYGPSWMWLGAAVVGAVSAWMGRSNGKTLRAPGVFLPPVEPPPQLRAEAIGSRESEQLTHLRLQLVEVLVPLDRLEPAAANELRKVDLEAAPPLHALIERLEVLDRMQREMPGTSAGDAARKAAEQVRERLSIGCSNYESLLTASAGLLSAPDLSRTTDEILAPAVQALTAYAHGLQRAANPDSPL